MKPDNNDSTSDVRSPQEVINTWFKDETSAKLDIPQSKRWFLGGKKLDQALSEQYAATLAAANEGKLSHWLDTAQGTLALIVVTDQFNRNINRGTAAAFALDNTALAACKHALAKNYDSQLTITQRVFCYMPLEHDETQESQTHCIALFRKLVENAPPELKTFTQGTLQHALEHQAIIEQFGRYPHRNAVLGRASTRAETDWLDRDNKRFGQ